MSKKVKSSKSSKQKKGLSGGESQADKWLNFIDQQLLAEDYKGAVVGCERLLNYLPLHSPLYVRVLGKLGVAHGMLQNFAQSYVAFTKALELAPNNAEVWFNRGRASRLNSRFGRSLRDYERAAELNTVDELKNDMDKEVDTSREFVRKALEIRGPDFTLDQLIEQEDLFQQGLALMQEGKWEEAEQAFRASITMSDCLPQPWANLAGSMIMQKRYDEAEAAWKRALVIDPEYTLAERNLAALPDVRRNGPPATVSVHEPFRDSNLEQSVRILLEE